MFSGGSPFGGSGSSSEGPNYEEIKAKVKKALTHYLVPLVIVIVAVVAFFSSVYTLNSGENGVITRFGLYVETIENPGLHFRVPFVDRVDIVNVEGIYRMEFGFRSGQATYLNTNASPETTVLEESLMLTGDEDLVNADWVILYRIKSPTDYLFKVDDPNGTLRIISESAYRRVVASHSLDDVLTDKKDDIQREIMEDLQDICNKYQIGVQITGVQLQDAMPPDEVREAFLDVSSAREERQSKINEASKYENEQLPNARGQAAQLINSAEAYKEKRINDALGAVARYKAIETEYSAQASITRTRLYLEMIREVLPRVDQIYFVNDSGDFVKFLPLSGSTVIPREP